MTSSRTVSVSGRTVKHLVHTIQVIQPILPTTSLWPTAIMTYDFTFLCVLMFSSFQLFLAGKKGLIITKTHKMLSLEATPTPYLRLYIQCGPKVLVLIFFLNRRHMRKTHTFFLFKLSSISIHTGFCTVVQFLKSCRKFLFWGLL